ncbi:MAG: MFS transporter, partial [SAR202 cluster bacterium]|nr:MFS transporter [SAR202 cluster bacterium]
MSSNTTQGSLSQRSVEIPRGALFVLLGATFVSLFGVGIIVPILPVYATDLGASGFLLGVMTASFSLASAFVQPFVGAASDKYGRKPFIIVGLAMYSVAGLGYAFAPDIWSLFGVRAFQGAGAAMIFPIAMAYIGDRTPEHREGYYMGLYNVAVFAGIGAGPIIGGVFKDTLGMDAGFYAMAAASLLATVFIALMLRENDGVVRERERDSMWRSFVTIIRSRRIKAVYALRLAFQFVTIPTWAFLPLMMIQSMDASGVQIGIIVTIRTMVSASFQPVFGWLGDRQSKV